MWIDRTPQEKLAWANRSRSQASRFAFAIGASAFIVLTACLYFGVSLNLRAQMFAGAATRPVSLGVAIFAGLFIGIGLFRDVRRSELKKMEEAAICPLCNAFSESSSAAQCSCGGTFVPTSEVRWVDDDRAEAQRAMAARMQAVKVELEDEHGKTNA